MDKTHLYSLPKDLLIKLITTIEKDTENRVREEYALMSQVLEFYQESNPSEVYVLRVVKCAHQDCTNGGYLVEIGDDIIKVFSKDEAIKFAYCDFCRETLANYPVWCSQHAPQYLTACESTRTHRHWNECHQHVQGDYIIERGEISYI